MQTQLIAQHLATQLANTFTPTCKLVSYGTINLPNNQVLQTFAVQVPEPININVFNEVCHTFINGYNAEASDPDYTDFTCSTSYIISTVPYYIVNVIGEL